MTLPPETHALTQADLVALLAWYQAAGVDCALGEAPIAWLGAEGLAPGVGFQWPAELGRQRNAAVQGHASAAEGGQRHSGAPTGRLERPAGRDDRSVERGPAASGSRNVPPPAPVQRAATPGMPAPGPAAADIARAPPARFATGAPDAAETAARSLAAAARDLAGLKAALDSFEGCALKATAKSTCVWRGAERARVMIIGEAPGRDEDLAGMPFVGRAGQLLDRMLAAIDLDESDVHITNVVYWRPPGNRPPTPQETQICLPFLRRQVALVQPDAILLLGGAAAKTVLDTADGIMKLRGKWREVDFGGVRVRALATLHPAYLLRTPAGKRTAWRDLLTLKAALKN